jgi:hypothetical protein
MEAQPRSGFLRTAAVARECVAGSGAVPGAKRRTTARLVEECTCSGRRRRPSVGTARDWNEPSAINTSSPLAPRSHPCALAAAHFVAAAPPKRDDVRPNSHCDRTGAPTPPRHSRSVAVDRPRANLPPRRFRVSTNARSDPGSKLRLLSSARSPLRRCPAVAAMRQCACGHRSPHSDWARSPGERLRSESAGRS